MKLSSTEWDRFRTPKDVLAFFLGTWFGSGLLPKAPGTWGSLASIPLLYFSTGLPMWLQSLLAIGTLVAGIWSAGRVAERLDVPDASPIVIDEALGMWVTTFGLRLLDPRGWLLAFALFRVFDVLKPWPIRLLDRRSKQRPSREDPLTTWKLGFWIVADDLLAGLFARIILMLLIRFASPHFL